jgi:hypothetical protein
MHTWLQVLDDRKTPLDQLTDSFPCCHSNTVRYWRAQTLSLLLRNPIRHGFLCFKFFSFVNASDCIVYFGRPQRRDGINNLEGITVHRFPYMPDALSLNSCGMFNIVVLLDVCHTVDTAISTFHARLFRSHYIF